MARRNQITVREGTGERNWYPLVGYVVVAILATVYVTVSYLGTESESGVQLLGAIYGVILFLISVGGVVVYPALFKDSAYLRGIRSGWNPKWWRYIAVGAGPPVLFVLGGAAVRAGGTGVGAALLVHPATAVVVSLVYLYNRHRYVGVP